MARAEKRAAALRGWERRGRARQWRCVRWVGMKRQAGANPGRGGGWVWVGGYPRTPSAPVPASQVGVPHPHALDTAPPEGRGELSHGGAVGAAAAEGELAQRRRGGERLAQLRERRKAAPGAGVETAWRIACSEGARTNAGVRERSGEARGRLTAAAVTAVVASGGCKERFVAVLGVASVAAHLLKVQRVDARTAEALDHGCCEGGEARPVSLLFLLRIFLDGMKLRDAAALQREGAGDCGELWPVAVDED